MNILVVEQNREERLLLKKGLPSFFSVTTLSSGNEALAFARSHHFDLVMISLSEQNTREPFAVLNKLRCGSLHSFAAIAILNEGQVSSQKLLNAGFNGIIEKPVHFDKLIDTISEIHERSVWHSFTSTRDEI